MKDPDLEPCDDPAGHEWSETEVFCESCGGYDHYAVTCRKCDQYVDLVWYDDPREENKSEPEH